MEMEQLLDQSFDAEFTEVLKNGLTWLPWVGKSYQSSGNKLLVVGESHYTGEQDPTKAPQKIEETLKNKLYTREVVFECPINDDWGNPMFRNLHKSLLKTESFDRSGLWKELSFYNFVQRPMEYRIRERPTFDDFFTGWRVFIDVLKILKPATCVFIGVAASNSFNDAMAALGVKHQPLTWEGSLDNVYLRTPASVSIDGAPTKIFFIKHTSQYFSWGQWNDYLKKQIPNDIARLEKLLLSPHVNAADVEVTSIPFEQTNTKGLPTHLSHKPIIACNYTDITRDDSSDAKYISVGHAQYDHTCASVKIWRHGDFRWSRQSEEVPIERLGYTGKGSSCSAGARNKSAKNRPQGQMSRKTRTSKYLSQGSSLFPVSFCLNSHGVNPSLYPKKENSLLECNPGADNRHSWACGE